MSKRRRYRIGHLFSGMGGGALGCAAAEVRLGRYQATFETVGGVDFNEGAARDFERLTRVPCALADVHEMQPADLIREWGPVAPDMILSSPPCKFASALLPSARAAEPYYQRMGQLALEGVHLVLSTWPDAPPRLIFIENVPRIRSRGAEMLSKLRQVLHAHDYAIAEGIHDCGSVGGLAQHRRRWFLVARHRPSLARVVYQPPERRVRGCGEVLADLPLPLGDAGGPLHRMPSISWLSWLRLALIPAGGDWRDLAGVVPEGSGRREVHRRHALLDWNAPAPTIGGSGSNGACNVADPRLGQTAAGAESFKGRPGLFGVLDWNRPAQAVTAGASVSGSNTPASVADPRIEWHRGVFGVRGWEEPATTITGHAAPARGAFSVADPRLRCQPRKGAYGVLGWDMPARVISAHLQHDNGCASVADPRVISWEEIAIPADLSERPNGTPVLIAADGTWHRPLSTLELAALQGFPTRVRGEWLSLDGRSSSAWRERIGNAIPPPTAEAIGRQMLAALLASDVSQAQEALMLDPVWVEPERFGAVCA